MKNIEVGKVVFPFIGLSGKEGDSHRQEIFAVPGGQIKGRKRAESAARRMSGISK